MPVPLEVWKSNTVFMVALGVAWLRLPLIIFIIWRQALRMNSERGAPSLWANASNSYYEATAVVRLCLNVTCADKIRWCGNLNA
jgi:hypothetical protein